MKIQSMDITYSFRFCCGRRGMGWRSARLCTGTTFVLMRSVCCWCWKAKNVLLVGSWLKHSGWLR